MQTVSIERCDDYSGQNVEKAIEKLIDQLGGWKKYIKPGKRVVIKPNLLMFKKPEEAATTHPSVVKAVIRQVNRAGGVVTIAESPGGPYNQAMLKYVYKTTGIEQVADETGAILNFDLRVETKDHSQAKYIKQPEVLKPLFDSDIIINLPKLKTHAMMSFTGAIKNMFGAVAGTAKADLHLRMPDYDKFADSLIDIYLSVKPTLNIMDAIDAMEGCGPTNGTPRHLGILLASADGFALDATAVKVIQLPEERVPILQQAGKRGLFDGDIRILGEKIEDIMVKDFDLPIFHSRERYYNDRGFFRFGNRWFRPRPVINEYLCVRCGNCMKNCPPKVIVIERGREPFIDYKKCIRCFCCHELCPHKAVSIHRNILSKFIMDKRFSGMKHDGQKR